MPYLFQAIVFCGWPVNRFFRRFHSGNTTSIKRQTHLNCKTQNVTLSDSVTLICYYTGMPNLYHTLNRGVDKRNIFLDKQDYLRFIHDLYEFNDEAPANNNCHCFRRGSAKYNAVRQRYIERSLLVDIHAFCLMPTHYHLLLSPRIKNGIPLFMKKVNGGYVQYFNNRYSRKGTLFEGRYKSVPITEQAHFIHLPYYIHLNPLDMFDHDWRARSIQHPDEALRFLQQYRWSSHLDYLGKKNFPSVTQRDFLLDFFGGHEGYKQKLNQWVRDIDAEGIRDILLEK